MLVVAHAGGGSRRGFVTITIVLIPLLVDSP